jgi:hypothetical protein
MERRTSLVGRMLAELDADPDVDALRRRGEAAATERELRALDGAWTAAVLRALWRVAAADRAAVAAAAAPPAAEGAPQR